MHELCEYITGQYSDGWGEGFEQRDILVADGYINVHFWQREGFHFQSERVQTKAEPEKETAKKAKPERPRLKLLGHDGNIFSVLAHASRLLKENGQPEKAKEMRERVTSSHNYYTALAIISEYVETELSLPEGSRPDHAKNPPPKELGQKKRTCGEER